MKSALDQTIARLTRDAATEESGQGWISLPADELTEDLQARAIQNVAQTIIHEMRPLIRSIRMRAADEIEGYERSRTSEAVMRLGSFLETVERLQAAATPPKIVDFDLRDLSLRTIREAGYTDEQVIVFRENPVISRGDPELLGLALRNLIVNAVEASEATRKRVTVHFASTDSETWIVVLDEGVGLPKGAERVWEPGRTLKSKREHFGWGLPIAQRAVHSFGGSLDLTPREGGGTAAEIRWAQGEEPA